MDDGGRSPARSAANGREATAAPREPVRAGRRRGTGDARLGAVLDTLPFGVFVADENGAVVRVNAAGRDLFGPDLFLATDVDSYAEYSGRFHSTGESLTAASWPLVRALTSGEDVLDDVIDFDLPDGAGTLTVSLTASPLRDSRGRITGAVATVRDVTRRTSREDCGAELNALHALILSSLDDLDGVLGTVLDRLVSALGAAAGAVQLPEGDTWAVRYAAGLPEAILGRPLTPGAHEARAAVDARDAVVLSTDLSEEAGGERLGRVVLAVPLMLGDLVVGTMTVIGRKGLASFDIDTVDFVRKLGAAVALAMRTAESHRTARAELRRAMLLQDVALATSRGLGLEAVSAKVVEQLVAHLDVDAAGICVLDGDSLRLLAGHGCDAFSPGARMPLASGAPPARAVREARTATSEEDAFGPRPAAHETFGREDHRYVAVPLEYGGRTLGSLFASWRGRRPMRTDEIETMSAVGHAVTQALENARLYEAEASARASAVEELHATSILLAATDAMSSLRVDEVLQTVVEAVRQATHCRAVGFLMLDHQRGEVTLEDAGQAGDWPRERRMPVSELAPETCRVLEDRRRTIVDLDAEGVSDVAKASCEMLDARRVLIVPVMAVDHLLGALLVHEPGERHRFTAREIALVEAIATEAAIALENAELYEAKAEAARLNARLADIDVTLHSTLESSEIIRRAVEEGALALGAASGALSVYDDCELRVSVAYGLPDEIAGCAMPLDKERHSLLALDTREIVAIEDTEADGRCDGDYLASFGISAVVVCPLIVRDEAVANLYCNFSSPRRFSSADIDFVRRLGSSLSLALQNAQAYEAEHRIAQTLQGALLTLPDEVPGISMEHLYQAAAQTARVGGDFYDVFELEHHLLGIVIGDVSGKGLDAAVLTALVKNTIRAHAVVKGNTPAEVMRRVNEVLLRESRLETYVTVCFAMLDRRDGRLVYCNAGHPAPFILRTNGLVARLKANSTIAGAFTSAVFGNSEAQLGNDELLFLYTDGLTEARTGGQLYGEERLFVRLAGEADTDPRAAIRRVVDDAVAFAGGKLSDDLAVLAIRRQPLSARLPVQQKLPLWAGQV